MMMLENIAASRGYGMQLMIRKGSAEMSSRGRKSVEECVIRISHAIAGEDGLQAAFIKTAVVGDKRNAHIFK